MNTQNYKNSLAKFPLSTDSMDFMQEQLLLVGKALAKTTGVSYMIISDPTSASADGLCIFNGEIMPLKYGDGNQEQFISLVTETESVTAKGITYTDIREIHYAQYSSTSGVDIEKFTYPSFQCTLPKGSIIMWSGSILDWMSIPQGYIPCCDLPSDDVIQSFKDHFNAAGISYTQSGYGFTVVNGQSVPDMSGSVVIGAGQGADQDTTYTVGRQTNKATISASGTDYVYGVYYLIKYI